jgi:hypothetical protein
MRYEIKLPEGQLKVLERVNAVYEDAKAKLDLVIGTIVLGKVKAGQMQEIKDGVLVLECDKSDILELPATVEPVPSLALEP